MVTDETSHCAESNIRVKLTYLTIFLHCLCDAEGSSAVSLCDLLRFVTGADRLPPLGFPSQLKVDFYVMESSRHYPWVSTCDMRIWLPRGIADPEMFQQLLEEAITGAHGFGKI